ncbi:MAG TPA: ribosome biogenesis GTP-binding protein YihA/YsxC [Gemmatimonadaceae bacterium]|nr:ribosome biogenesis GTP-binding protein YihA/YsxC [Gemmatimonadaceae bacterium]
MAEASTDPLVVRSVEFLGGMASPSGWRPANSLPEVAFSGRSNVGKSSLLNTLVRRSSLARVSQTPGKTREINFFAVNGAFALVDLPGYGFARVSKQLRGGWRELIEGYLRESPLLRGVVQLVDARHDPSRDDHTMIDFLAELGAPTIIVATKIDKLKRADASARPAQIARQVGVDEEQVIPFSAVTGEGRDELAAAIVALVEAPSWRAP